MTRPVVERTLFVTRYHPVPAHTGTLQYSSQLIAIFAALSARLDVVCQIDPRKGLVAGDNEPEFPDNAAVFMQPPMKPSLAARILSPLPHTAITHATADNRRRLDELLRRRPACVVLDHIASAWAYRQVAAYKARHPEVRVVYCTHNMERDTRLSLLSVSWRRPAWLIGALIDVLRIDRSDRRLARLADLLTCISSADARRHAACYRPRHTAVVRPTYRGRVRASRTIDADVPRRICIVGSFLSSTKKSNLSAFLTEGYELFAAHAVEVLVVGRMDATHRRKLEAKWPKVTFTGPVARLDEYMDTCRIGVIPEAAGGGFPLKSLEYVFNRLPIFSLARALVDLPLAAGANVEVRPDMGALCRAIVAQIDRTERLDAMQASAFDACAEFRSARQPLEVMSEALLRAQRNGHGPRVVGPVARGTVARGTVASRPAPAVGKEAPCTMRP